MEERSKLFLSSVYHKFQMNKNILILISMFVLPLYSAEYDVGDMIDMDDQSERFDVCNGDYFNADLGLSDLNGDLNGGHYFVSWFDISATW